MILQVGHNTRIPNVMHRDFWIVGDPSAFLCPPNADTNGTDVCIPAATTAIDCACPAGEDDCPSDSGFLLLTLGGMSAPVVLNQPTIIRLGSRGRVFIQVVDCDGAPADATSLTLDVLCGESVLFCEDFFQPYIFPKEHRIIKVQGKTGLYYIDWGDIQYTPVVVGGPGVFPTGFVGGEVLTITLDIAYQVVFGVGDQTVEQVAAAINAQVGPLVGQPIASVQAGKLLLTGVKKGSNSYITLSGAPAVLATLGLTAGSTAGTEISDETSCMAKLSFVWKYTDVGSNSNETIQVVYVLPLVMLSMLPRFRQLIDKSLKMVSEADKCFLGYTDATLIGYLLGGLEKINAYQPSVFFTPANFPYAMFGEILIESALIVGVMSQTLFAIDTDITSYSDQGQSFVINHQQPLASFLQTIVNNLDRNIPLFKLHFVKSGSVLTQQGPSYRLNTLMEAAPNGSLFRGVFFKA